MKNFIKDMNLGRNISRARVANARQRGDSTIANKINQFADSEKKYAFMFDFQNKDALLSMFAEDLDLIDCWHEVTHRLF
jgi:hypothetical protein